MKAAFLYFDDIHHIFHNVTTAIELSRLQKTGVSVDLLTSTQVNYDLLESILAKFPGHNCRIIFLKPALIHRLVFGSHRKFPRKSRIFKRHLNFLREYDILVSSDFTAGIRRNLFGDRCPKLAFTGHGAGDRSYGFRDDTRNFDFLMIPGKKKRDRFEDAGILQDCDYEVTGYAKFDYDVSVYNSVEELFPDTPERQTVVYNPHFSTQLSSWSSLGEQVLDYFCASDKFNLIFAPHIMLFDPRFGNVVQTRWQNHNHVHIDTGSLASSDRSYTKLADIYIGDVSSQIYEFLAEHHSCIFLNTHDIKWQGDPNYLNWSCGEVLTPQDIPDKLDQLLDSPEGLAEKYLKQQEELMKLTFSMHPDKTASVRAAEAIVNYLNKEH